MRQRDGGGSQRVPCETSHNDLNAGIKCSMFCIYNETMIHIKMSQLFSFRRKFKTVAVGSYFYICVNTFLK